jgi:hypothetical protein
MINKLVAGLTLAEGITFGVLAYVKFSAKSRKLARCQRTWGDVIDVKEQRGGEEPTKHPVIRYKATNGEVVTYESKFGRSNWKVRTGARVEILADPDNASESEVVNFLAQWGLVLAFAVIAAGSIIAAPLLYLLLR